MTEIIGISQLEARLARLASPSLATGITGRLGLSTVREAKILVPRKTGNLGRSIHVASTTATTSIVAASAQYAPYVEYGTRPHIITPKAKKALAWASGAAGGQFRRLSGAARVGAPMIFARIVHHPGTRAQPFLIEGAKVAVSKSDLKDVVVEAWNV